MSEQHFIHTEKTALITTLGDINEAQTVWIILHGYGQKSKEFYQHFLNFNLKENYFVLPDALNYFYLKSGEGEIGASWMTKYEREKDIEDNNRYLNKVYQHFVQPHIWNGKKLYVLGFSQGAATLVRWLAMNDINASQVILWGAAFPPDMEQEKYLKKLHSLKWLYFVGTEDEYITIEEKEKMKAFFETHHFNLKWIEYTGKHSLKKNILKKHIEQ